MEEIYIFGAHSRAQTLGAYLKILYPDKQIRAYLVNNGEVNAKEIEGIPVIHIKQSVSLEVTCPVYLGIRGIYHEDISKELKSMGFHEIIPVTPTLDTYLRNEVIKYLSREQGRRFSKLEDYSPACIYVIKSAFDKSLQDSYTLTSIRKEIQVGASLTDKRVSDVLDNTGENISDRNRQFCELTGLFWIWKNAKERIVGLEHYRRHFILPSDWMERMEANGIDVVLPTPLYVAPSLAENYCMRHEPVDWEYMHKCLREQYPEDYADANKFFAGNWYSPCNMFIMRKDILNDLCQWMFPIIFACAEHGGLKEDSYQNRYPGFLAERLMSFYFDKNQEKYKVVYADKNFLT